MSSEKRPATGSTSITLADDQSDDLSLSSSPGNRCKSAAYSPLRQLEQNTKAQVNTIFLFVNPTSGGNAAASFTRAGLSRAILKCNSGDIEFFIIDIREGVSGDKPGFHALKRWVENTPKDGKIYVIMAGGDGTVLWGIQEIIEHHISFSQVVIGVIPYGTGNDFARSLNWHHMTAIHPFNQDLKAMKDLCEHWLRAEIVKHDLWNIVIELHPDGCFKKIDSKSRLKVS